MLPSVVVATALLAAASCTMPDYRIADEAAGGATFPDPPNGGSAGKGSSGSSSGPSLGGRGGATGTGATNSGGGSGGVLDGGASGGGGSGGCTAGCGGTAGQPSCSGPLGTTTDCTRCGEACTGATPFCSPAGCVGHLPLQVGGPSQHVMQAWNGSGSSAVVGVDHTLTRARGGGRLVLVGVASSGPFDALSVLYDDTPMLELVEHEHISRQSRAAIYYLLDAQLPASAGQSAVSVTFDPEPMAWGHGGFDVLELVNAAQTAPALLTSTEAATCDGPTTRGVSLTFDAPGSLVYGVLAARGAPALPVLQQSPPIVESWNQRVTNLNDALTGSSAWVYDDNNRSFGWSVANCYNSVAAAVVVQRLSAAAP